MAGLDVIQDDCVCIWLNFSKDERPISPRRIGGYDTMVTTATNPGGCGKNRKPMVLPVIVKNEMSSKE